MAGYGAPNARQLEILAWIGKGCPEREWPDFTHKTSAVALQSRGLAEVSKRGGVWSATITDAGRRVLAGEAYETVRPSRTKVPKPSARSGATTASVASDPDLLRRRAMASALLARLAGSDGLLEIAEPTDEERAQVRQGVSAVEATGATPAGKVLRSAGTKRGPLKVWVASPSAVDVPISSRQYDVMQWALDGCPERDADAATYRSAARQLHNRGLLHVVGNGANLTATVTSVGKQVMTRQKSEIERRREYEQRDREHAAAQRREEQERRELGVSLIAKVAAAGGRLEVGGRLGSHTLHQIIAAVRRDSGLPHGQRLEFEPTMMDERLGYTVYFAPDFTVQIERSTVLVPAQLRQPSSAVTAFRARRLRVTKDSIPRAARILQAVIDAAHERSWTARDFSQRYSNESDDAYDATIEIGHQRWNLLIRERNGSNSRALAYVSSYWDTYRNTPHLADSKMVRNRNFEATGALILNLHGDEVNSSRTAESWSDDKKHTLESQLPDLFRYLDIAAARDDWKRQESERRSGLIQERWKQVRAEAVEKYRYAKRARQLGSELERRESARQMRDYADELTARASDLDGDDRGDDALAWVEWIRAHATKTDPLNASSPRMRAYDRFTDADLQPYLGGWTSYGPSTGTSVW